MQQALSLKKLLEKYHKDSAKTMCLKGLLKLSNDEEVYDSQSEIWLNKIDRGYLKHINDIGYDFFIELEISTYDALTDTESKELETLHDLVCKDEDIVRIWSMCVQGIGDTSMQQSLLLEIVKEWIKVRGNAIADMELEKHKKTKVTTTKKKSLRKELKRTKKT